MEISIVSPYFPLRVLLVAEGTGGHLIPALQVASELGASGAAVAIWYSDRRKTARLMRALTDGPVRTRDGAPPEDGRPQYDVLAIPAHRRQGLLGHWRQWRELWARSQRCFDSFAPDVVVGFGGWISLPVVLAARWRGIGCLIHEQNVTMGRTNRLLARWVDRVAVSFTETRDALRGIPAIVTGVPIRPTIGRGDRLEDCERFGFDAKRPILLVLGGSQGARAVNELVMEMIARLSGEEGRRWQFLHLTGSADEIWVRDAYTRAGVTAWVAPSLVEMEAAYAQADVVLGRAGASTIAELSRCGKPAVLIPYPHAGGHQRFNARLAEAIGGAVVVEERPAAGVRLHEVLRTLLGDARLRAMMGTQMHQLGIPDATTRLARAIRELSTANGHAG